MAHLYRDYLPGPIRAVLLLDGCPVDSHKTGIMLRFQHLKTAAMDKNL